MLNRFLLPIIWSSSFSCSQSAIDSDSSWPLVYFSYLFDGTVDVAEEPKKGVAELFEFKLKKFIPLMIGGVVMEAADVNVEADRAA